VLPGARSVAPMEARSLVMSEWSTATPESQPEILSGVSLQGTAAGNLVATLRRNGVVDVVEVRNGIQVTSRSYVGRIRVGPLEITILPKIAWRRWLTIFGFGLRLRGLVRTERVTAGTAVTSLQDILVLELLAEARDLVGRGLHRDYVRQRKALAAPKGHIDFGRIAKSGGLLEATVPCRFTRRSDDSPLNRALLAGLRSAAASATDRGLKSDVRRLAQQLADSVAQEPLSRHLIDGAWSALDRRTSRYAPALRLIELLFQGTIVDVGESSGAGVVLRGFALDMNSLWQRVLARVLTEWSTGLEVREEYPLAGLISADPDYSPKRRGQHVPRPDYAAFDGGRLVGYLDAKYRDIWEVGLPREMLYQLALYAAAQGVGAAAILYPCDDPAASEERLLIHDPRTGAVRGSVACRPVHLAHLESLIAADGAGPSLHRSRFANALIAGLPARNGPAASPLES